MRVAAQDILGGVGRPCVQRERFSADQLVNLRPLVKAARRYDIRLRGPLPHGQSDDFRGALATSSVHALGRKLVGAG